MDFVSRIPLSTAVSTIQQSRTTPVLSVVISPFIHLVIWLPSSFKLGVPLSGGACM